MTPDEGLDRIAGWIDANLDQFRLRHARSADHRIFLVKPLGELVLAAALLAAAGRSRSWCGEKAAFVWEELEEGELLLRLLAARPDLIVISTLYANFRCFGHSNARLETLLEHLAATACCRGIEFPAWRRLDVAHGLEALGFAPFPRRPLAGTWLGAFPEPWLITDDLAYAATHEIFYITDFGARRARLDAAVRSYVATWLPAWLRIYAGRGNWDLFGEFVMVGACLGRSPPGAVDLLAGQIGEDGLVPGPHGSAATLKSDSDSAERGAFLCNYHTTLVAMMALALSAGDGRAAAR